VADGLPREAIALLGSTPVAEIELIGLSGGSAWRYQARRVAEFGITIEAADVRSRYADALADFEALRAKYPGETATDRSDRGVAVVPA
jgi:hypothetical protein